MEKGENILAEENILVEENIESVKKKNYVTLYAVLALLVVAAVAGTYAYFSLNIGGNPSTDTINVGSARMSVLYDDGAAINGVNILPDWTVNKNVTITNTGDREVKFDLVWKSLSNDFIETEVDVPELVYSSTCSSKIGDAEPQDCPGLVQTGIPTDITGDEKIIFDDVSLLVGETKTYSFTFKFLDLAYAQDNQNREFHGYLNVEAGGNNQYTNENPTANAE